MSSKNQGSMNECHSQEESKETQRFGLMWCLFWAESGERKKH